MRVEVEKNKIRIIYEKREWQLLENKYEELGLKIAETHNAFGNNNLKYYRDVENLLSSYYKGDAVNDINKPLIYNNKVNIAILRVIPNQNGEQLVTEIHLDKLLSIVEVNELVRILARIYKKTLELTTKATVKIIAEIEGGGQYE